MAKFLTHMEHTEEGAKLILTEEQEKNCRVVYRRSQKDPERFVFAELWDPEKEYPDDHVIVPLRSSFDKVSDEEYPAGTVFANVVGSDNDPRHGASSWIKLIRKNLFGYDTNTCCAEANTRYNETTGAKENMTCKNPIVGGHVIMGSKSSRSVDEGAGVELLPICSPHNTGRDHGAGYYMKLARPMKTVILKNYLQKSAVEAALAKEAALAEEA